MSFIQSNNIDQIAPIDQQLPDKTLSTKSLIDEKSEANIAGDNAA